jgi:site-specific DNA-methyltransferase (adenine-specific)
MLQGDMKNKELKIHPTQKPVRLYEWLLQNYAKDDDIILDTHVGSASSLIACRNTNHKYVGFEIDEEYYRKAKKRLDQASAQMNIFDLLEEQHESQI